MKRLTKLWCWLTGHNPMWPVCGHYYCQRCLEYVPVQFEEKQ